MKKVLLTTLVVVIAGFVMFNVGGAHIIWTLWLKWRSISDAMKTYFRYDNGNS